ncbi:Glutamate receptor 2.2 [Thalictrum thalictroides]|uniref:Glutamate receptor 2.2 n=1 Tax=Thalictrum thalictroides TaxID=46969 RepID=A0A7J6X684_THATH|nr:Glutamate receptor 2.2 [Thalictrum thalictroides]
MKFKGLSGEFNLINERLQPPGYQIVNVIGKGEREIGFWTPTCGISRQLQFINNKKNCSSTSINKLGPIIWPGESLATPLGWMVPNKKFFKVGVPESSQFEEFVSAQKDPRTDEIVGNGFSIDVFKAVVDAMPVSMPFQFIPIRVNRPGDEDSLINEVILKNIDVLVAATSIQLNQSFYVDFSTPYTDLGVSMIVPIPTDQRKDGWVFLKPFTTILWLTSIATFMFTVTVVALLEHQINTEFWKKPKIRLSTVFWFSLSTSIHRDRVESNMSKFVVIIWVIVLFVLTSSYTASLSSLLTVQQLTTTTISGLQRNNDYLGYRRGSFVLDLLKRWYFDESKLKALDNLEEYHEALSKGSGNGGVAAIVDEVPFVNIFLSKHCSRYTSIGPIYNSDGFGFVFQKGSFLTSEFSAAISKLKDDGDIDRISNKWSRLQPSCENITITPPSNSLSLDSFWVLFLFMVTASSIAALLHIILAFYKNYQKRVVQQKTPNNDDDLAVILFRPGAETDLSSFRSIQTPDTVIYSRDDSSYR